MAAKSVWVGLDVGADQMAVCCTDAAGKVLLESVVPSTATAFHELFKCKRRRIRLISMESGSSAIPLTRSLRRLGYRVAVFNSRQASRFLAIRQNKTDRNDARGLAELARFRPDSVSEVRIKTPECQRLRSTLVTRQRLVSIRCTAEGSIRSLFRLNGGRLKNSSSVAAFKRNVASELRAIKRHAKVDLTEDIKPLLQLSEAIRTYIKGLDEKLLKAAEDHPICRSFLDISGVGPICALSFYSTVEDAARFNRNADIGPYLGMVPIVRQSEQSASKRRISKRGDAMTRSYLTNSAVHHLRHGSSSLTDWGRQLVERAGKRRAHVAVARKLAVIMIAMWKSGDRYDPHHRSQTP